MTRSDTGKVDSRFLPLLDFFFCGWWIWDREATPEKPGPRNTSSADHGGRHPVNNSGVFEDVLYSTMILHQTQSEQLHATADGKMATTWDLCRPRPGTQTLPQQAVR